MASPTARNLLVFGATGTIGKWITSALLAARPRFDTVSIFTSDATVSSKGSLLAEWKGQGLTKVIAGDVTSLEQIKAAYADNAIDTVISCTGRGALLAQLEWVRLAEESGTVQWFFPSEYGTDVEFGPESADEKPHQFKLKVRKYFKENVRRMTVTYLVTGPYADMYFYLAQGSERCGGFDAKNKEAYLIDDGGGRVALTTMADVGTLLVAALQHPVASANRALKVSSFVRTQKEILAEFERQTGGMPWTVTYVPLGELKEREQKLWADGKPTAVVATLRRIWASGGTLYDKWDNEAIGMPDEGAPLETLEAIVQKTVKEQLEA